MPVISKEEELDRAWFKALQLDELAGAQSAKEGTNEFKRKDDSDLADFCSNIQSLEDRTREARTFMVTANSSDRPCDGSKTSAAAKLITHPATEVNVEFAPDPDAPSTPNEPPKEQPPDAEPKDGSDGKAPDTEEGAAPKKETQPQQSLQKSQSLDYFDFRRAKAIAFLLLDDGNGGDDKAAHSCCTFGENPTVTVGPATKFSTSISAKISKVSVEVKFSYSATPMSASFNRAGLCYAGICDDETLSGSVWVKVKADLSIKASGDIKIGKIQLTGASAAIKTSYEKPKLLKYTLACNEEKKKNDEGKKKK